MGLRTFLSVAKEKYQKNRHLRKVPRYFPYGSYPLSGAPFCRGAKGPYALLLHGSMEVRNLGGAPSSRFSPVRGDDSMDFLFFLRVSGEMSADGAPPFVRAIWYPRPSAHSDSFAPLWAKGSRAQVVGSVREAPWGPPLRGALLVLFSQQGEKSTHIDLPDKPQFIKNRPHGYP